VAEWLDLLAPVVLDAHAELAWPETLALDNTWFMVENRRTHTQTLAFNVLGAYGYPAGARRGRVWALHASHQAAQADWEAFLRSLDVSAPPKLVITDGSAAIGNAVRAFWPVAPGPSLPVPFLARCERHLHVNGGGGEGGRRHRRLGATGCAALDTALGTVRDFLDSRSFVLRNKRRTNLTLGLIRLHLNGVDLQARYHTLLRQHIDETGGILPPQRTGKDTGAGPRTDRAQRAVASLRR